MNKRELAKIPVMDAPEELVKKVCESNKDVSKYMVTAELVQDDQILLLYFFSVKDLQRGNTKAVYRFFISSDEYITQDLQSDKVKWLTGKINNTLRCYKLFYHAGAASNQDDGVIRKFFHKSSDCDPMVIIQTEQDRIHEKTVQDKLNKERLNINAQMQQFQTLPEDFDSFLREEVMNDHYLFYSRKENYCFCTKCRNEYTITGYDRIEYSGFEQKKLKHNEKNHCRMCGSEVTCKGKGMGRGLMLQNKWALLIQKHGKKVHTRIFSVYWDLRRDYRNTEIIYEELYRSVFSEKSHNYYEMAAFHGRYEERWCHLSNNQMLHHFLKNTVIYCHNIPDVFQDTPFQYCMLDEYVHTRYGIELYEYGKAWDDSFMVDNYLALYQKRPYVESLMKLGCHELVKNMNGIRTDSSKNTLPEILLLNRQHFKILMKATEFNPGVIQLFVMQRIYELLKLQDSTDIIMAFNLCENSADVGRIENLAGFVSVRKLLNYLAAQRKKGNLVSMRDMEDHYNMLNELHYDIRENLLPADFEAEHDRISLEVEVIRDEKQKIADEKYSGQIRARMFEMKHLMNFQMNGLMVMAPQEAGDLRREGRTLRHCVGTYVKQVAEARTNIFFIRKEETPEVPYFTIEINMDGNMIQCRGKNNCDMPDEVKEFATAFTAVIKQYFEEQKEAVKKKKKVS